MTISATNENIKSFMIYDMTGKLVIKDVINSPKEIVNYQKYQMEFTH